MRRCSAISMIRLVVLAILLSLAGGCLLEPSDRKLQSTLFIGIDASGSFKHSGYYKNALRFLAHYIYGHVNGLGGLSKPHAMFVGSVGGRTSDEPKTFHPIHDFQGKSIAEIEANLRTWFAPDDTLTDFNAYFEEVARITKERNLILAPITITLASDGVPDFKSSRGKDGSKKNKYQRINLKPLEYLSRNITVRLTYPSPKVGKNWRDKVPRQRVRLWTVDGEVMKRWPSYIEPGVATADQTRFWTWLKDTVDFKAHARRV